MPERIDYRFLGKLEGGSRTIGYVPAPGASKSGVTIATGFDLGQRNEDDLRALKLDQALITQLQPYLGMTGANAQALLVKTPLLITVNQAQAIDSAIKSEHVERLRLKYDTAPGNRKRFIDIPPEAQTVIASVSFQYGVGLDLGSSRDLGEVVVDGSEVGRLAVAKQTDPLPLPRHAKCYVGPGLLGRPCRRFIPGASGRFAASVPF